MDNQIYIRVCETFTSLQGEGLQSGFPFFFIRLTGCNLRCTYCDTSYAWSEGVKRSVQELISLWQESGLRHVLVTGGEPLIQEGTYALMDALLKKGATVLLETNGSISLARVNRRIVKVVDWKTPGSGSGSSFFLDNLRYIDRRDQIKFVITSRQDYKWASRLVRKRSLPLFTTVLFSPCYGQVEPKELASWILEDRLEVMLQLQLHKVIWGDQRGL